MAEVPKTCVCKNCDKKFTPYYEEYDCRNCQSGLEEVDNDMGRYYRSCSTCSGLETVRALQVYFCDENCEEEYYIKQTVI